MRFHFSCLPNLTFILAAVLLGACASWSQVVSTTQRASVADLPIEFEPNYGQAEANWQFLAHLPALDLGLHALGFDLHLTGRDSQPESLWVRFINADRRAPLTGSQLRASQTNYLLGQDPTHWHTHVPNFARVTYSGLYPGIDAVFYGSGQKLEHDFVISPGADYHAIRMRLSGARGMALQTDGRLRVRMPTGDLFFAQPEVYQVVRQVRHKLSGNFMVVGRNEITFQIGPYDHSIPLIIDPVLIYSTFFADTSLYVSAVATDSSGSAYLTGVTNWSNFPVTPGAFGNTCGACPNGNTVFVTKLTPDGTALAYSTFLGGTDSDGAFAIAVDHNGNAIVVGATGATGFPLKNPITHGNIGYSVTLGFISSLSADGSSLNYSSIIGGSAQAGKASGTAASGVVLDSNGTAYITGTTDSPVFPVTPGAYNQGPPAYPNTIGFVTKFLSDGNLAYSSLIGNVSPPPGVGGAGFIGISGIAVDPVGSAYITGTAGSLWPTTPGAYQTQISGTSPFAAPFVTKLAADASSLVYSTFIGGSGQAAGIAVDANGEAIFVGSQAPSSFPTTSNAYKPNVPNSACCPSYISKVSADGSQLLYSTFFYGNLSFPPTAWTSIVGIALDNGGNIWIAGNTSDVQFPLQEPIQSVPGPLASPSNSGFVSEFDPTGIKLMFSSYFGGPAGGIALAAPVIDSQGKIHIAGTSNYQLYTSPSAYLGSVTPNSDYAYGFSATIDSSVASPAMCVAYPANQGVGFPGVAVGSSASVTLQITNCGTQALSANAFQSSSPVFTVPTSLNGCTQQVAVNHSCALTVTFIPTSFNVFYNAVLTISGNTSMPLLMPISGSGVTSLGLSAPGSSGTATVAAGGTANYTVSIGGAGISGTAVLKCTGAPANTVCSVPSTVSVSSSNPSTFAVSVTTSRSSMAVADFTKSQYLRASAIFGLTILLLPLSFRLGKHPILLRQIRATMAITALALLLSCGGGSSAPSGSSGTQATTPGTYTLTVTATAGSASQSLPLTLTVTVH